MTDIHAAIGRVQLSRLRNLTKIRQENANYLSTRLSSLIEIPVIPQGFDHVFHQYTVKVDSERDFFALKLKELAYMHAEGFAAGELKHGPIALIEDGIPVFVVVPPQDDELHDKIVSNIQEVRARGALTIVLAEEGDESINEFSDHIIRLPKVPALMQPLVATVPLQIFSCEMATVKGYDVDQPRNLAKSVTVE